MMNSCMLAHVRAKSLRSCSKQADSLEMALLVRYSKVVSLR